MGVPGAELDVVTDHEDGHTPAQQCLKDLRKGLLEFGVQTLGGLVHQQDVRLQQQHLGQRRPLLFPARQVVGVTVQQFSQTAQGGHIGHLGVRVFLRQLFALQNLIQILADGLFYKQSLGILRQHPHASDALNLSPVGLCEPRQQLQAGGLAGAVAAQQSQEFAFFERERQPFYHIRQVLLILEPQLVCL